MGTALDIPRGKMADMSIRLTELAGDMASFYDVSQEDIAKSLQSVFPVLRHLCGVMVST